MPTEALLARFLDDLTPFRPLAVWAHGSLGGGDYQEGRSDLDLIAVLPGPLIPAAVRRLIVLHQRLRAEPLAGKLHCSYLTPRTAADPARSHLTWAHDEVRRRPVTPVTRRELHEFGRVRHAVGGCLWREVLVRVLGRRRHLGPTGRTPGRLPSPCGQRQPNPGSALIGSGRWRVSPAGVAR